MVESDHVTSILVSDWSGGGGAWPLRACVLAHCLVLIAARPLSLTSPANEDTSPGQPQPQQTISTDSSDTRIANINSLVFPEFTQIRREVLMKSNKVESTSRLKILESTLPHSIL